MNYNTTSKLKSSSQKPASFRDEPLPTNKGLRGSQLSQEQNLDATLSNLENLVSNLSREQDTEALKSILLPYLELRLLQRLPDYKFIDSYIQELIDLWKEGGGC